MARNKWNAAKKVTVFETKTRLEINGVYRDKQNTPKKVAISETSGMS
jgi:hypothetical protein